MFHRVPLAVLAIALAPLAGCEGTIGEPLAYVPGEGLVEPDAGVRPVETPDAGMMTPPDAGAIINPFESGGVTIGVICTPSGPETRMVITAEPASCESHARILNNPGAAGDQVIISAPDVSGPTQFNANAEFCLAGDCSPRSADIEIDAFGPAGAIGRWTIPLDGEIASGQLQATVCQYDSFLPGRDPSLVPNLQIDQVALYQGPKIPIAGVGAEAPGSPIIEGRDAFVRVFVAPQAGFLQQRVTAELTWDAGNGSMPMVLTNDRLIARASTDGVVATTLNFDVPGAQVSETASWSVKLRGEMACGGVTGDTSGAVFPTSGTQALETEPVGTLRVVLVPFRYDADGSARLPDISDSQLEAYREKLMGMYPIPDLDLTVREPVPWDSVIAPNGQGWSQVLQALLQTRAQDDPPDNTYYYGIFAPASSARAFCGRGCVAGLGPLAPRTSVSRRGAVGLGFTGQGATNTCAHEIGHAAGRQHAPCGVNDSDPNYPTGPNYQDADIGVWSYDITSGALKSPTAHKDVMSYCDPEWISDYNYNALFDRFSFVNRTAPFARFDPAPYRMLVLSDAFGNSWGDVVEMARPPIGEEVSVQYLDRFGRILDKRSAVSFEVDHLDDVIVTMPAAPPLTAFVKVGNRAPLLY